MSLAIARNPRTANTNVNLSVGLLMLLLIGSLVLFRLGSAAATSLAADVGPPEQLWRVPLIAEARGAATAGRYSFILTKDKLGAAALMIVDNKGLLVRTESLGSTGRFAIASSQLGAICTGRDQGTVALYGSDGKRRWTAHLPGPVMSVAANDTGVAATFGPQPGDKAGDGVMTIAPDGAASRPVVFAYGAVTGVARGPGHSTAVAVFTADPRKAAEALVFLQPDGTTLPVAGQGLGAARLAAGEEMYFVGTANGVTAYDSCGGRRWTARSAGVRHMAAGGAVVVAAERSAIVGYGAADGDRLWRRNLAGAPDTIVADADGVVVATSESLIAFDWQGRQRWTLSRPEIAWDLGDGTLIVIERDMAVAYRTR